MWLAAGPLAQCSPVRSTSNVTCHMEPPQLESPMPWGEAPRGAQGPPGHLGKIDLSRMSQSVKYRGRDARKREIKREKEGRGHTGMALGWDGGAGVKLFSKGEHCRGGSVCPGTPAKSEQQIHSNVCVCVCTTGSITSVWRTSW